MKNLAEFDHLKELEKKSETYAARDQYIVVRLDGHAFSRYTKGMTRPFDHTLRESMASVTKAAMKKFGATFAFQQSDEISFVWQPRMDRNNKGLIEHPYSGRVMKLSTLMASYVSIEFFKLMSTYKSENYEGFDGRGYPCNEEEAFQSLKFRFLDCASNAYQSIAQSVWSPKQLNGISIQQIKANLAQLGAKPFEDHTDDAMVGVYFYKEFNEVTGRHKIVRSTGREMMDMIKQFA